MDTIESIFSDVSIKHDTITLYYPNDAIRVIEKCKELDKKVYGIEAFRVNNQYIQPFMEFSTDYSYDVSSDPYAKAIEHIKKYSDRGFVFEIVYEK